MSRALAAALGAGVSCALAVTADVGVLAIVRLAVLGGALAAVAVYDADERRIPNRIVLPAAAVCGVLALVEGAHPALLAALALVAALLLLSLWRPGSFGMGDVKLVLLIVLGLDGDALGALVLGVALAAVTGFLLLVRDGRGAWKTSLPLAPFLALGVLGALLASSLS